MATRDVLRRAAQLFDDRVDLRLAHEHYEDGELPLYSVCGRCARPVRIDRRDLIDEHRRTCRPR